MCRVCVFLCHVSSAVKILEPNSAKLAHFSMQLIRLAVAVAIAASASACVAVVDSFGNQSKIVDEVAARKVSDVLNQLKFHCR